MHCHKPYRLLEPLPVSTYLLDWVSMDFITGLSPLKWCGQVYNTVLVVIDIFIKYCWYYLCTKNITTDELTDLFYNDFIYSYVLGTGTIPTVFSEHVHNNQYCVVDLPTPF